MTPFLLFYALTHPGTPRATLYLDAIRGTSIASKLGPIARQDLKKVFDAVGTDMASLTQQIQGNQGGVGIDIFEKLNLKENYQKATKAHTKSKIVAEALHLSLAFTNPKPIRFPGIISVLEEANADDTLVVVMIIIYMIRNEVSTMSSILQCLACMRSHANLTCLFIMNQPHLFEQVSSMFSNAKA